MALLLLFAARRFVDPQACTTRLVRGTTQIFAVGDRWTALGGWHGDVVFCWTSVFIFVKFCRWWMDHFWSRTSHGFGRGAACRDSRTCRVATTATFDGDHVMPQRHCFSVGISAHIIKWASLRSRQSMRQQHENTRFTATKHKAAAASQLLSL